jgi:hypothetical protein
MSPAVVRQESTTRLNPSIDTLFGAERTIGAVKRKSAATFQQKLIISAAWEKAPA